MKKMDAYNSSRHHANTSKMTSRTAASVRQPVSCDPCRRRKIKCSRTRPPCTTCQRRGCTDDCVYTRNQDTPATTSGGSSVANEELLVRIRNLENLLRKQTGVQLPPADTTHIEMPMLSPPVESVQSQPYGLSPESITNETACSPVSYSADSPSSFLNNRIGLLTKLPSGDVRYEPQSSQWTSVFANTGINLSEPALIGEEIPGESGFPFATSIPSSLDGLIASLPPMQHCEYLKDTYFKVFSPLFHILHDPSFHAEYANFLKNPASVSLSWLAILFVIISLAVTALESDDPLLRDLARGPNSCSNVKALGRRYREAAMNCLAKKGILWGKHDIQSLQALIMLGYAMSHSQEPTWVLLGEINHALRGSIAQDSYSHIPGMTYNVAIALGCHIDPDNFGLDPIQCEERRRCFAGLTMLYTIQSTALGNPDPSWRLNHDVKLPANVNDVDITLSGILPTTPGPSQMSYLLFKFRLYDLTALICKEVFTSMPSGTSIEALDQQICAAQESWDLQYLVDSSTGALPTHHAVHLHILHGYAHQLFLLLHRPFFAQSVLGLDIPNKSQIRCIASAQALLDIHRLLCETPAYRKYLWYTNGLGSFHAFHAAAVLAVALQMPIYRPQWRKFRNELEETVVRFEASADRSPICGKAVDILKFLLVYNQHHQQEGNTETMRSSFAASSNGLTAEPSAWSTTCQDDLRVLFDRLQPQQWLGPAAMPWDEWEQLMKQMNGVVVV